MQSVEHIFPNFTNLLNHEINKNGAALFNSANVVGLPAETALQLSDAS